MGAQGDRWRRIGKVGLASGVAGWALENTLARAQGEPWRFSALFGKLPIPFLPVYAAGGAAIAAVGPSFATSGLPWPIRGASYALLLGLLEVGACKLDRKLLLEDPDADRDASWHYGEAESVDGKGCVDEKHALAWGVLGLLVERFARPRGDDPARH